MSATLSQSAVHLRKRSASRVTNLVVSPPCRPESLMIRLFVHVITPSWPRNWLLLLTLLHMLAESVRIILFFCCVDVASGFVR